MMCWLTRTVVELSAAVRYCIGLQRPEYDAPIRPSPTAVAVWGLLVGLIVSGAFAVSWKYFGDIYFSESTRLRLVPSVMVILAGSILNFKQLVGIAVTGERIVLGEQSGRLEPRDAVKGISLVGLLVLVLAILLKFSVLLAMPYHTPWWPNDWRRIFSSIYPRMHTRVFILMGLWGKAGLLIAGATGSQSSDLGGPDRAFRRALKIRTLILNLAIVTAVTVIYFSSSHNRALGLLVSVSVFLVVYIASMLSSHRQRGHDRYSMFACAEVAELTLLLGYLAITRYF